MKRVVLGGATVPLGAFRAAVTFVAGLALAGGLALGIARAAPPTAELDAPVAPPATPAPGSVPNPQGGQPGQAGPGNQGSAPAQVEPARVAPRRPLHRVLASFIQRRLNAGAAQPGMPGQPGQASQAGPPGQSGAQRTPLGTVVTGRVIQFSTGSSTATVFTGGRPRAIRLTAQTRIVGPRPQPGDVVVMIGRPAPDGSFAARAINVRRQRQSAAPAPQAAQESLGSSRSAPGAPGAPRSPTSSRQP